MNRSTDERTTPLWFFRELDREFHFDLDAAATKRNTRCPLWLGPGSPIAEDALAYEGWFELPEAFPGGGVLRIASIFLNPPYSALRRWVAKAVEEIQRGPRGGRLVMLLPSDTSTRWFHDGIWDGDRHRPRPWVRHIRFPSKRLAFGPHTKSAKWPTMVVVFGR